MTKESEDAFKRIQSVNWAACGHGVFRPELRDLYGEYMETARQTLKQLGTPTPTFPLGPLFHLIPTEYADRHRLETVEKWIDDNLERYNWRSRHYIAAAAYYFVLWHELSVAERIQIYGEAASCNPYAKLIEFLEGGGAFTCEHGMFDSFYPISPEEQQFDVDSERIRREIFQKEKRSD